MCCCDFQAAQGLELQTFRERTDGARMRHALKFLENFSILEASQGLELQYQ